MNVKYRAAIDESGKEDDILLMLNEARFSKNYLGRPKKAIKICDKILKSYSWNRDAMLIKAGGLKELGKVEEFLELCKKIIEKWPEHWEAYYLMSIFLFCMHENKISLELMEKSVKLDENFDNIISYAHLLYLVGRHDYIDYIEKAKKIDKVRTENFLKNIWIWDTNNIKTTRKEEKMAQTTLKNYKKAMKRFQDEKIS